MRNVHGHEREQEDKISADGRTDGCVPGEEEDEDEDEDEGWRGTHGADTGRASTMPECTRAVVLSRSVC